MLFVSLFIYCLLNLYTDSSGFDNRVLISTLAFSFSGLVLLLKRYIIFVLVSSFIWLLFVRDYFPCWLGLYNYVLIIIFLLVDLLLPGFILWFLQF